MTTDELKEHAAMVLRLAGRTPPLKDLLAYALSELEKERAETRRLYSGVVALEKTLAQIDPDWRLKWLGNAGQEITPSVFQSATKP